MENIPTGSPVLSSMTRRLLRRAIASGRITLPAVPGMLDQYVKMCDEVFIALGVHFSADDLAHLRGVIESQLNEAYTASQRSDIVIIYEIPIGYYGRSFEEGKKITWRDGYRAVSALVGLRLNPPKRQE